MSSAFTHDDRLPYTVTSSVHFDGSSLRLLRCTAKGNIASGAELFDAPVIHAPLTMLADVDIAATRIITPDRDTTDAITAAAGVTSFCIDDFVTVVRETAAKMNAVERDNGPLQTREATDAASSAYATAQRLYDLIHRQMPRVQAAFVTRDNPQ